MLATADQPDFVRTDEIELEPFLEDVFMRWSEVAPAGLAAGRARRRHGSSPTPSACAPRSTR